MLSCTRVFVRVGVYIYIYTFRYICECFSVFVCSVCVLCVLSCLRVLVCECYNLGEFFPSCSVAPAASKWQATSKWYFCWSHGFVDGTFFCAHHLPVNHLCFWVFLSDSRSRGGFFPGYTYAVRPRLPAPSARRRSTQTNKHRAVFPTRRLAGDMAFYVLFRNPPPPLRLVGENPMCSVPVF